jgi:iron complex outermembrane receptor protein
MCRRITIALCTLSFAITIATQHSSAQTEETIELNPVVINALPFEKYAPGSKIQKTDSLVQELVGHGSLADLLAQNSTVYVREQGNKMLASISFRGTGASHTGVYWHGINLNSLTLGQSDPNNFNMFLFDDVAIQYGGAGSLHGSDAIGGSLHLQTSSGALAGTRMQIRQDAGSFGSWFTGAKVDLGRGDWSSSTRMYHFKLQNDFKYPISDRLGVTHEVTQENASVHDYAILQELHYRPDTKSHLSLSGWYQHNYQELQPLMVSHPDEAQYGENLLDNNLRLLANYDRIMRKGQLNITVGYIHDDQLYDGQNRIEVRRIQTIVDQHLDLGSKTVLKVGGSTQYIRPNVHSFSEGISEWRTDLYTALEHSLTPAWQLALNIRQSFVPNMAPPVAPSLSTRYRLQKGASSFLFRAQAERSYRIPTLNDRYWGEQGRMDLNAEHGYSGELGHTYSYAGKALKIKADVAGYVMLVDNWITWRPEGRLWRPANLKEVHARGVELDAEAESTIGKLLIRVCGLYAWNRSVLKRGIEEHDPAAGYQLPYTPEHRAVLGIHLLVGGYRLSLINQYTGMRRELDVINGHLDPYLTTNLSISKNLAIGSSTLAAELQVLNALDTEYQNMRRFAMPGRNYLFSIRYYMYKGK